MTTITKQFHWFVTSAFHYRSGYNLEDLLADLRTADRYARGKGTRMPKDYHKAVNIWRVPGGTDQNYAINYFAPQVEGALFVGSVDLSDGLNVSVGDDK